MPGMRWSLMISATGSSRDLQLGQRVERGLAAGGAHHAVGVPILPAQVLDHGLKDAYVVVNCQEDRPRHMRCLVKPPGPFLVNGFDWRGV